MPPSIRASVAPFLLLSLAALPLRAASVLVQGAEFRVNALTVADQSQADVGVDANGNFVVVWRDTGDDYPGPGTDIRARRFNSLGTPVGVELLVNTHTEWNQSSPAVAVSPNGSFVVVWQSYGQDFIGYAIIGRTFDSNGAPGTAEFLVNSFTEGNQYSPDVAAAANGDFVVVWQSKTPYINSDVRARVFDSSAQPHTLDLRASFFTANQAGAAVGVDPTSAPLERFVVTWERPDGNDLGVFARRFLNLAGNWTGLGDEFQVPGFTLNRQARPDVAVDAHSGFVIAFEAYALYQTTVFFRPFNADGTPRSGARAGATGSFVSSQRHPAIASRDDGRFVIVWNHSSGSPDSLIEARSFTATGEPESTEFLVATTSVEDPVPAVAGNANGQFLVGWNDSDADDYGVFARRLIQPSVFDVDGNGTVDPLTDGLLMLRYFFGFTGNTLIAGAVSPDCTRCTAQAIADYLAETR